MLEYEENDAMEGKGEMECKERKGFGWTWRGLCGGGFFFWLIDGSEAGGYDKVVVAKGVWYAGEGRVSKDGLRYGRGDWGVEGRSRVCFAQGRLFGVTDSTTNGVYTETNHGWIDFPATIIPSRDENCDRLCSGILFVYFGHSCCLSKRSSG